MPYQADVTDLAYRYDGSFPGFLCCLFESFAARELPAAVLAPDQGQLSLFGSRNIPTDPAKAARVARGLERLGGTVQDRIATGFLSDDPDKDLILLRFARLCFERGPGAARMLGDPDVAAAFALARAVGNEAHLFIEFIRFEERDGMLGAVIHPKNRVLPLLVRHFCSRLPDESFLIFDATHGMALVRRPSGVAYLRMERYLPGTDEAEQDWQRLWKRFYDALTIQERRNPVCQRTHQPKRFWQDMCEMRPVPVPAEETPGKMGC